LAGRSKDSGEGLLPMIRILRSQPDAPVFFPSLLQESLFYNWQAGNQPGSYLFAPLVAYPVPNRVLPLPVKPTDDAKAYIDRVLESGLASSPEVLFVDKDDRWQQWISERMERAGFRSENRPVGNFNVMVFRR
jgi:hypothetical protein